MLLFVQIYTCFSKCFGKLLYRNLYGEEEDEKPENHSDCAPKSLNSDISWFGVGGKQAIFFIGGATRVSLFKRLCVWK